MMMMRRKRRETEREKVSGVLIREGEEDWKDVFFSFPSSRRHRERERDVCWVGSEDFWRTTQPPPFKEWNESKGDFEEVARG